MKLLVTGGAGFIGTNFIRYWLKNYPNDEIVNLDKLTYAGDRKNLAEFENQDNYRFVKGDICDADAVDEAMKNVDTVVHFGAESIPEHIYIPVQSTVGTRVINFGELWKEQSRKNKPQKTKNGEVIYIKGKQTKALSFLNGGQWMPIEAITRHQYKGKLIKLKQKWGIIEATPNHSIYSASLELSNPKENPELLIVRGVNEIRKKYKRANKNLLQILSAYITEGNATFNKANGGYIVEISQNNKRWLEKLGEAIEEVYDLNYCIIKHKKNGYRDCFGLQVSNKIFFNYLIKNCGKYSDGKYFPNWIFDLTPNLRDFFWQNLLEGDGTKDGRYTTTSYKLANQISLLLTLQNIRFRVYERHSKKYKTSWEFKTNVAGQHYGQSHKKQEVISYDGWVYDLEVEKSHNFVCGIGNVVCHNTHVDRSIKDPQVFLKTNILGTDNLLRAAVENKIKRFHFISTDEVFGALELGTKEKFNEVTHYDPRSPYSASKAAADHLVMAYWHTFGLPITISNCSNNYGPWQYPEKFMPRMITNIIDGKKIPIYGDGKYVRDWLYVTDHCRAIDFILRKGRVGQTYCVGGLKKDVNNLVLAKMVLKVMGKDEKEWLEFITDRAGHDRRYAVDWSKINEELGWRPKAGLEESIKKTVDWYRTNEGWWREKKKEAEAFYENK